MSYLQFNNYIYLNQDQKTVDLNIRNQLLKVDIAIVSSPDAAKFVEEAEEDSGS